MSAPEITVHLARGQEPTFRGEPHLWVCRGIDGAREIVIFGESAGDLWARCALNKQLSPNMEFKDGRRLFGSRR